MDILFVNNHGIKYSDDVPCNVVLGFTFALGFGFGFHSGQPCASSTWNMLYKASFYFCMLLGIESFHF